MLADRLRATLGRRLETGSRMPLARAAASVWGLAAARSVARPVPLPGGVRVIGVGGAVLGGAGKTPLAVALALALAASRERVALVGHAYRAAPGRARIVRPGDPVAEVGDDALACARLLADSDVIVVVGPRRGDALRHAADLGRRVLVADGLLQTAPVRLDASILVLDAGAPWGAGACPPAGDLRAPREALLAAADHVAAVLPEGATLPDEVARLGAVAVPGRIEGAVDATGARRSLAEIAALRVGLLVAIARPRRVLAALAAAGVRPAEVVALGDHAVPSHGDLERAARAGVAAWLTTVRCATKLPPSIGGAPVLALVHRLDVGALAAAVGVPPGVGAVLG